MQTDSILILYVRSVCVVFIDDAKIMVKSNLLIIQKTLEITYIESNSIRKRSKGI